MEALKYPLTDYAIFFLMLAIISSRLSGMLYTPVLQIITRWITRLSSCIFATSIIFLLSSNPQIHPFWAIFLSTFLGYFLIESIYVWVLIKMFSQIDFPLFPRFSPESETIVWANGKYAQNTRTAIQEAGFRFSETLGIKTDTMSIIISPIFYSKHGYIRLQVLFPNFRKKHTSISFVLTTYLRNGTILVTHNIQSPSSMFFAPPFEARFFNIASVRALIKLHKKRIKSCLRQAFCLSGENCQQVINHEQLLLEEINLSNGNCTQSDGHEHINLSFIGRYQLWINMLRLSYIGR